MSSPTARTLEWLRKEGHLAGVVERHMIGRWPSGTPKHIKHDLFGFIDILSICDGEVYAWQATSGSNTAARVAKIREHEHWPTVLSVGWKVKVIGWRKLKVKRGGKSVRWTPRVVEVT